MKKTITLLVSISLALGISAQNFGVGLDYMMLSGTMVKDANGDAVTYAPDAETAAVKVSSSSAVLNVNYTHNLSEKLDMVGSIGLGMGFGLVPMKASLSYGISSSISANLGMGMYMITDDSYMPTGYVDGANHADYDAANPSATGSTNELGMSLGLKYHMDAIGVGLGYEMIKGGDHSSLNAFTISLSYAFGGKSTDASKKVVKKATKPKKEPKATKSKK